MSQSGPLHPFRNFLVLWNDGRWDTIKFRLEPGEFVFRFLGTEFVASPSRTRGGWEVSYERAVRTW